MTLTKKTNFIAYIVKVIKLVSMLLAYLYFVQLHEASVSEDNEIFVEI